LPWKNDFVTNHYQEFNIALLFDDKMSNEVVGQTLAPQTEAPDITISKFGYKLSDYA